MESDGVVVCPALFQARLNPQQPQSNSVVRIPAKLRRRFTSATFVRFSRDKASENLKSSFVAVA
jgi:hypothetical protein